MSTSSVIPEPELLITVQSSYNMSRICAKLWKQQNKKRCGPCIYQRPDRKQIAYMYLLIEESDEGTIFQSISNTSGQCSTMGQQQWALLPPQVCTDKRSQQSLDPTWQVELQTGAVVSGKIMQIQPMYSMFWRLGGGGTISKTPLSHSSSSLRFPTIMSH